MRLAPHQTPWVAPRMADEAQPLSALAEPMRAHLRAHRLDACLVLVGGDHGYWREDRLGLRDGAWLRSIDSHRGRGGSEWTWLADAPHPAFEHLVRDLDRWRTDPGPDPDGLCRPLPGVPGGLLVYMTRDDLVPGLYVAPQPLTERFEAAAWLRDPQL